MVYTHSAGGSSPSLRTISVEMIYTDWVIDYNTEKRSGYVRVNWYSVNKIKSSQEEIVN